MKDKKKTKDNKKLTLKEKWENYKQKKPESIKNLKFFGLVLLYSIPLILTDFVKLNSNILNLILIVVELLYISTLFAFWICRKKYSYKEINFYSTLTAHVFLFLLVIFSFSNIKPIVYVSLGSLIICLLIKLYVTISEQYSKNELINNKEISQVIGICFVFCIGVVIAWYFSIDLLTHLFYCIILSFIAIFLIICLLYLIFENREKGPIKDNENSTLNKYLGISILILAIIALISYIIYQVFYNFDTNHTLFSVLMGVWACFLGGFLTLSGVAWTIKNQAKIKKEEERLKFKPQFAIIDFYLNKNIITGNNMKHLGNFDLVSDKNCKTKYCLNLIIKNTDFSNFKIESLEIDGVRTQTCNFMVEKNFLYDLYYNFHFRLLNEIEENIEIYLYVQDMLGNIYKYKILYSKLIKANPIMIYPKKFIEMKNFKQNEKESQ